MILWTQINGNVFFCNTLDFPANDTLQSNPPTVPDTNLVKKEVEPKAKCNQKIAIKNEKKKSSKSKSK